jgi:sec-independent protein translocase protein TatA
MPTSLGPAEILVILVVALVVLGPKRLPEAGRQIGRFVAEVRHWSSAVQAEIRDVIDLDGEPAPAPMAPQTDQPAATAPPASAPLAQPTPADLNPPAPTPPAPSQAPTVTPQPAATPQSSTAEWGLPEVAPAPPPPAPPVSGGAIPPEWATPPSANGDS